MQPKLATVPALLPILETLKPLEPLIYAANDGQTRAYFEQLLAPYFWEIAASGRRYSRDYVLDTLEKRQQQPYAQDWETTDYYLQAVAPDLYLITYTLHQPTRVSARSSLWQNKPEGWQMLYHQGTVIG